MNKRVFLVYGYSAKNAGDLAICIGAIDILLEQNFNVTLLSKYNEKDSEFESSEKYYRKRYGDRVVVLESPFTLNRTTSLINKIINNLQGLFIFLGISSSLDAIVRKKIVKSDIVIFNGGNLLRCTSLIDYVRLVALYYPIKLAKKYKKEYIIFPHSAATINKMGTGIIGRIVKNAKKVFAREEISFDMLKNKYDLKNIENSIDLAFFIDNKLNLDKSTNIVDEQKRVGFTFRAHTVGDIREFEHSEKEKIYRNALSSIKGLGLNYQYYFVIQTLKDRDFTYLLKERIEESLNITVTIFENYDPVKLVEFYSKIDLLIGMRLHSIILAASIGVPSYGVFYEEWGLKNPGLMKKLKLPFVLLDRDEEMNVKIANQLLLEKESFRKRVNSIIQDEKLKLTSSL